MRDSIPWCSSCSRLGFPQTGFCRVWPDLRGDHKYLRNGDDDCLNALESLRVFNLAVIFQEVHRVPLVLTRSHSLFFIFGFCFGSLLGAYEIQLKVPGVADDVLVSFPENHDPTKSWPVVFSYHGFNAKPVCRIDDAAGDSPAIGNQNA